MASVGEQARVVMLLLLLLLLLLLDAARCQETAALIVGGISQDVGDGEPSNVASAELFGCPGRGRDSYPVDDYPIRIYFAGGRFQAAGGGGGGGAVVCGGYHCPSLLSCQVSNQCFSWTPEDQWQEHSLLWKEVFDHTLVEVVNLDLEPVTEERYLLTVGPTRDTQARKTACCCQTDASFIILSVMQSTTQTLDLRSGERQLERVQANR